MSAVRPQISLPLPRPARPPQHLRPSGQRGSHGPHRPVWLLPRSRHLANAPRRPPAHPREGTARAGAGAGPPAGSGPRVLCATHQGAGGDSRGDGRGVNAADRGHRHLARVAGKGGGVRKKRAGMWFHVVVLGFAQDKSGTKWFACTRRWGNLLLPKDGPWELTRKMKKEGKIYEASSLIPEIAIYL